ncbi:MAG: aminotransferase class V-fold PLP-dependent enzyme [Myxococcota bacterium]
MTTTDSDLRRDWRGAWDLDPSVTLLNHGSYGACPTAVLAAQRAWRDRLERNPVGFFLRTYFDAAAEAREALGAFLGADPDDLAFVTNASSAVNAVLRSLPFEPGDEILVTDVTYQACRNAADFVAARTGAKVVVAELPFPCADSDALVDAILSKVTSRTVLALLDHITSATALVLPLDRIVPALEARGVDALVDAAHAPGQVEVDLDGLGAAYSTGNCHKWLCSPKGAAYLHVRRDRQDGIRPLTISHGASLDTSGTSRFRLEFDWTGTHDPTPHLSIPSALSYMEGLVDGGWPAIRDRNHRLALAGRALVGPVLGATAQEAPAEVLGSMVAFLLPAAPPNLPSGPRGHDPLAHWLWETHGLCVPIGPLPNGRGRFLRISAQLYNQLEDYERLAEALKHAPA